MEEEEEEDDLVEGEVTMRYLYTCGIAAWYCASRAKI